MTSKQRATGLWVSWTAQRSSDYALTYLELTFSRQSDRTLYPYCTLYCNLAVEGQQGEKPPAGPQIRGAQAAPAPAFPPLPARPRYRPDARSCRCPAPPLLALAATPHGRGGALGHGRGDGHGPDPAPLRTTAGRHRHPGTCPRAVPAPSAARGALPAATSGRVMGWWRWPPPPERGRARRSRRRCRRPGAGRCGTAT